MMWWQLSCDLAAANLEAQRVIVLRLMKLANDGTAAQKEARTMVLEKLVAAAEATGTMASGGSIDTVLRRYRTIMRANSKRLSKAR